MSRNASAYMPQLDSLRAFAVLIVLASHYLDLDRLPYSLQRVWWGGFGVQLFFVLSGFLITGILLRCRTQSETQKISYRSALLKFYARRSLRILPLYYGLIILGMLLKLPDARSYWPSLFTYTFNFAIAKTGEWPMHYTPFWSLAIEEQFYLLWPWWIVFCPKQWIIYGVGALLLVGPAWRYLGDSLAWNETARLCLTPASLDMLGYGALLAAIFQTPQGPKSIHVILDRAAPVAFISLCILITATAIDLWPFNWYSWAIGTAASIVFMWLVSIAARGAQGFWGVIFNSKLLQYLGRISYGIYAFHLFVQPAVQRMAGKLGWFIPWRGWVMFVVASGASVVFAAASWRYFEGPLNGLKRYFPYQTPLAK